MGFLDGLPTVDSFFGIDLKTGSMIIAALGIVSPLMYGCTLLMPTSYLLMTTWTLVVFFCVFSIFLMIGLVKGYVFLVEVWVWFSLIYVTIVIIILLLLALRFCLGRSFRGLCLVFFAILWYIAIIYFIIVVNSYRPNVKSGTRRSHLRTGTKGIGLHKNASLAPFSTQVSYTAHVRDSPLRPR